MKKRFSSHRIPRQVVNAHARRGATPPSHASSSSPRTGLPCKHLVDPREALVHACTPTSRRLGTLAKRQESGSRAGTHHVEPAEVPSFSTGGLDILPGADSNNQHDPRPLSPGLRQPNQKRTSKQQVRLRTHGQNEDDIKDDDEQDDDDTLLILSQLIDS